MSSVIYIKGPINSGKSTISHLLLNKIPNSVHIEVDDIRNIASVLDLETSIPFALEDTVLLMKNWINRGFHVIISWPISKKNLPRIETELQAAETDLHVFTLLPPLEICLQNKGGRSLNEWEKERILVLYQTIFKEPPGHMIDNSHQTPEETANVIMSYL